MSKRLMPVALLSMLLAMCGNAMAQPRIDLTEGSLYLLGGVTLKYQVIGFDKPEHKLKLQSDVGGGYFLLDGLAFALSIPAYWNLIPRASGGIGLKLATTYFFDINSTIFPYLGVNVTPSYGMQEKEFQLRAGLESGILVSMSENVALDFGIRPEIFFKLYGDQKWSFTLPAGFFGIKAVF